MPTEKLLYIEIYGFAVTLLVLMFIIMLSKKYNKFTFDKKIFMGLLFADFFAIVADLGSWLLDGVLFEGSIILHYIVYSLFYFASGFVFFLWYLNVVYILYSSKVKLKKRMPFQITLLLIYEIITLSSPFTHLTYYIDAAGNYQRGSFYVFIIIYSTIVMLSMISEAIYFLIKYRNSHRPFVYFDIIILPIFEFACVIIQSLSYGLALIWPATAIGFLFLFLMVQDREMSIDPLTHLKNRREMEYFIKYKMKSQSKQRLTFLMYLDLNNFKKINDILGHAVGDEALEIAARVLSDSIEDTDDVVFRTGGDEFCIIGDRANYEEIDKLKKLIDLNCYLINLNDKRYNLDFDIGISILNKTMSIKDWLNDADRKMYDEKEKRHLSQAN